MLDLSHNELDDGASALIGKIVGSHGRMRDEIMWVHSIRGEKPEEDPELKGISEVYNSFVTPYLLLSNNRCL